MPISKPGVSAVWCFSVCAHSVIYVASASVVVVDDDGAAAFMFINTVISNRWCLAVINTRSITTLICPLVAT